MILHNPLHDVLMGSIAERSISTHLAVAKLVVTRLGDVEGHWAQSSDDPLALAIAEGTDLRVTAGAPVVRLTPVQVDMSGEETSESRHGSRSVLALFVRS